VSRRSLFSKDSRPTVAADGVQDVSGREQRPGETPRAIYVTTERETGFENAAESTASPEESARKPASEAPHASETPRSGGPVADLARPGEGPTDAELERGILDAVRAGLFDVARTLSAQLEDRRRARGGNVVPFPAKRGAS
jgi:hypothetical protein